MKTDLQIDVVAVSGTKETREVEMPESSLSAVGREFVLLKPDEILSTLLT